MNLEPSPKLLYRAYGFLVIIASLFTAYVTIKPGISTPLYPKNLSQFLSKVGTSTLTSSRKLKFDKDSSDRKISPIYKYSYDDGTSILAAMVKVRKRDDFKIETYGLLTKNIDPFYLKNSTIVNSVPISHVGVIGDKKFIQTCIVPGSTLLSESDFRLANLTATVEKLNPRRKSLVNKILGNTKSIDYSCLVLTYQYPFKESQIPPKNWSTIVKSAQQALISSK